MPPRPAIRQRQGSAYIAVLVVLVLLSLIGLSLTLITRTERLIGANERTTQRVFYAADAGINIAIAKALVLPDHRALRLTLPEPRPLPNVNIVNRVDLTPLFPILAAPCNLCQINQGAAFSEVNHALSASATRIGWSGTGPPPAAPVPLAQKLVSVMIEFQPWQPTAEALADATSEQLAKIRF